MVSGTRSGKCTGPAAKRKSGFVGQAGVDAQLLAGYKSNMITPQERDEEKRNVHRVREYWLEHEAMEHLHKLLEMKIPVASFESYYVGANAHNSKYSQSCLRESMKSFFREHVDDNGVKYLTLKLSERPVCTKPSKNILKRWNLSNGMLYFFYAAVGRSHPPTGDEILEPFYYQKRIDFVRKLCVGGDSGKPSDGAPVEGKKRRRASAEGQHENAVLPLSELKVPATKEDAASLYNQLRSLHFRDQVDEEAVAGAVAGGVWKVVTQGPVTPVRGNLRQHHSKQHDARAVWTPVIEKVEEWSFENGALGVFVRACQKNWKRKGEHVWRVWNDDLGNNALEWEDLWRGATTTLPKDEPTSLSSRETSSSSSQQRRLRAPSLSAAAGVVKDEQITPPISPRTPVHTSTPPSAIPKEVSGESCAEPMDETPSDIFKLEVESVRQPEDDCLPFFDERGQDMLGVDGWGVAGGGFDGMDTDDGDASEAPQSDNEIVVKPYDTHVCGVSTDQIIASSEDPVLPPLALLVQHSVSGGNGNTGNSGGVPASWGY